MYDDALFPPRVYVKSAFLSQATSPDYFKKLIEKTFDKKIIEIEETDAGYMYRWQEKEGIYLRDFNRISDKVEPFVATFSRLAILLSPIKNMQILSILSTSDVVVKDLFNSLIV